MSDLFAFFDPAEEAEDVNEFGMPSPREDGEDAGNEEAEEEQEDDEEEEEEEEEEEQQHDDHGQYDDLATPGASTDDAVVPRVPPLDDPCENDDANEDEGGKDDFFA